MRSVFKFFCTVGLYCVAFAIPAIAVTSTQKIEQIRCTDHYWGVTMTFKNDRAIVEYRGEGWDDRAKRTAKYKNQNIDDSIVVNFIDSVGGSFRFESNHSNYGVGSFLDKDGMEEITIGTCHTTAP